MTNDIGGRAASLSYDSDHTALSLFFELPNDSVPVGNTDYNNHRYNFKTTNWDRFTKKLSNIYQTVVPTDRNLSMNEIDENLQVISNGISLAISEVVPKIKPNTNTLKYLNRKIKKLQKDKSTIVSLLHKLHITDPHARLRVTKIAKIVHKELVLALQSEFKSAIDDYWSSIIKKSTFAIQTNFLPKINAIFRSKQPVHIKELHIQRDEISILDRSSWYLANAVIIDNKYAFSTPVDKLNIMGAY